MVIGEAVTLATVVEVQRPDGYVRLQDVPVIVTKSRGWTDVTVTRPTLNITMRLSGAERISLIEALGGTVQA